MTQLTDPEGDEVDAGRKISGILADHQGFTLLHYLGRRSPHETSGPVIELYLNRERDISREVIGFISSFIRTG